MTVKFVARSLCFLLLVVGQNGGGERLLFAGSVVVSPPPPDATDLLHKTDGQFTTPAEWDPLRPTVHTTSFPVVGNSGGAVLNVEGSASTLYLMYDYFNSPANFSTFGPLDHVTILFNSTEPNLSHTSYAIDIRPGTNQFNAYEKPADAIADPGLNLAISPWTPLTQGDLDNAHFKTALGFDSSPGHSAKHLIAEFQLSSRNPNHPDGIYSPDPQFWSGSAGDPITFASEIFRLNPDGSVLSTVPALGPDHGPVLQQQSVVPEPGSLTLFGIGAAGLVFGTIRRRQAKRTA